MERLIADRVEEGKVILEREDLTRICIPASSFDFTVSEGDVLLFDGEKYIKDKKEKDERRLKFLQMQKKLKEKSKNK